MSIYYDVTLESTLFLNLLIKNIKLLESKIFREFYNNNYYILCFYTFRDG